MHYIYIYKPSQKTQQDAFHNSLDQCHKHTTKNDANEEEERGKQNKTKQKKMHYIYIYIYINLFKKPNRMPFITLLINAINIQQKMMQMKRKRGKNTCYHPGEFVEERMKEEIRKGHLKEKKKKKKKKKKRKGKKEGEGEGGKGEREEGELG